MSISPSGRLRATVVKAAALVRVAPLFLGGENSPQALPSASTVASAVNFYGA